MEPVETKLADKGVWTSMTAYISLAIFKLTIGYLTDSKALMADGLNNSTDILASVALLIGLRLSRKPPDHDHPYGHKRAESIASLIASLIMLTVGVQVLYQAVMAIVKQKVPTPDLSAAYTSVFCAVVMYLVYRYNKHLAHQTKSQALMAAAKDNLSDVWVSIGAAIAVLAAQFELMWLDPLAAAMVGILICKTAGDIFAEATHLLTDGIDKIHLQQLTELIKQVKGVEQIRDVKARIHGNAMFVEATICVDSNLTVKESHLITELIEEKVKQEFSIAHIHIHVEPHI